MFDFQNNPDGSSLSLREAILQAVGAASLCWEPKPTGVFDATKAEEIADALLVKVLREVGT